MGTEAKRVLLLGLAVGEHVVISRPYTHVSTYCADPTDSLGSTLVLTGAHGCANISSRYTLRRYFLDYC